MEFCIDSNIWPCCPQFVDPAVETSAQIALNPRYHIVTSITGDFMVVGRALSDFPSKVLISDAYADILGETSVHLNCCSLNNDDIGVSECIVLECPAENYFEEIEELCRCQLIDAVVTINSPVFLLSYKGTLICLSILLQSASKYRFLHISSKTQIIIMKRPDICELMDVVVNEISIHSSRLAWPDLNRFMTLLSCVSSNNVFSLSNFHPKLSIAGNHNIPPSSSVSMEDDWLNLNSLLGCNSNAIIWNICLKGSPSIIPNSNTSSRLFSISLLNPSIRFSSLSASQVLRRWLLKALIICRLHPIVLYISSSVTRYFNSSEPLSGEIGEIFLVLLQFICSDVLKRCRLSLVSAGRCHRLDDVIDTNLIFPLLDSLTSLCLFCHWMSTGSMSVSVELTKNLTESLFDNLSFRQLQTLYCRCVNDMSSKQLELSHSLIKHARSSCMFPSDQITASASMIIPSNVHKTDCNAQRGVSCMNELYGFDDVKSTLKSLLFNFQAQTSGFNPFCKEMRELFNYPSTGVLLYGPPGSGKTSLARSLSREVDANGNSIFNFLEVSIPNLVRSGVGDTEKELDLIFSQALELAPSIVFIDEISCIFGQANEGVFGQFSQQISAQLKERLDDVYAWNQRVSAANDRNKFVFVVAATNEPWKLDSSLIRLGRFDVLCYIGELNDSERISVVKRLLLEAVDDVSFRCDDDVICGIAVDSAMFTVADLVFVFKNMIPIEAKTTGKKLELHEVELIMKMVKKRCVSSEFRSRFDEWRLAQHAACISMF